MKLTKETVLSAYTRFVREFGRMPTKADCASVSWLPSANTIRRLTGTLKHVDILRSVYNESPKACVGCGTGIPFEVRLVNKFCSSSCACTTNNRLKPRRAKAAPAEEFSKAITGMDRKCWYCFKHLEYSQKLYCSLKCHTDHKFMTSMCRWLLKGNTSGGNKAIRKYLTFIDGYKCVECGNSDWNSRPLTLEVEHKSGDSTDDSRANTCLICPNCHSQTDTYKGKNRGNGRHSRMVRYREGKSF